VFHSLKTKIFLLVCTILALVAVLVLYFTHRDVEQAMFAAEQRSARNVLELVELNIQSGYRDLLRSRLDAVNAHRRTLQGMAMVARNGLDEIFSTAAGSQSSRRRAAQRALDWLSAPTSVEGTEFLVFDHQGRILASPHTAAQGGDLNQLRDIKGNPLADAVRQEALRLGEVSTTFFWTWTEHTEPVKKFGWFVHYPPMDWIVGVTVNIDELEREGQRKLQELLDNLRANFAKIRIAQSGYLVLFNAEGEMLIHPENTQWDLSEVLKTPKGRVLLQELQDVAEAKTREPLRFTLPESSGDPRVQEAFCGYFRSLGWYVAAVAYVDEVAAPAKAVISRLSLIIAGVLLASLMLGLILAIRMTRPLNALTAYAKSMPQTDFTSGENRSASIAHLPARHQDEVGRLAGALIFMEDSLRDNVRSLIETTAQNERMEGELNVAREIQLGLLPKTFPAFPERHEFDLFAMLEPAREVGGDLYDFLFLDQEHFCFAVGDVSDKGVPAALFMAITRTLLRAAATRELDPARIMESMNNDLAPNNPNSMFVTLFIGVLNVRTGRLTFANGGHNQPVLLGAGHGARFVTGRSGPMVGAMEDLPYSTLEMTLAPGDTLFLYTDGVTEAMNANKDLYSDERLLETLGHVAGQEVGAVIQTVQDDVTQHVAGAEQSDDITMLCLTFRGQ